MTVHSPIFMPVIVLVLWTMVMWLWMYATRIPAMNKSDLDAPNWVGGTGAQLDEKLPPQVQWKAHNYNHLLTEPTLFYVVAIVLGVIGAGTGINLILAWAYVVLRVVHSLIQATWNRVVVRFVVFATSSLVLIWLALNAFFALMATQ